MKVIEKRCIVCNGKGERYNHDLQSASGVFGGLSKCPDCEGTGWIVMQREREVAE